MSTTNDTQQTFGTAHVSVSLGAPRVRPIQGYPGSYAVYFGDACGDACDMHVTAEEWDAIDTAVRAGIAAAQTEAAAS